MSDLNVKVGLIGKLDMLKFKNMGKVRENMIQSSPANEISGVFPINENAKALHPDYLELVIDRIIDRGEAQAKTFVLKRADGAPLPYFRAGQYISLKLPIDGSFVSRSYSLCSSPKEALNGLYSITVRANPGGFVADRLLEEKKPGDTIISSSPQGFFYYEDLRDCKNVIGLAGGSGITPFLSMARALADGIEDFSLTLLFGSRDEDNILFRGELDELARICPKFKVIHVLSEEEKAGFEHGFITAELIRKYAPEGEEFSVFLCDTTGEMMGLFGIAKVAFVGKSLSAHGSQNMIEPCLCGVPTVVGPYTENFRPVMSDLLAADALVQTPDAPVPEEREAAVVAALLKFFAEPEYARGFAERAVAAVERRRGVTARVAKRLLAEIGGAARQETAPTHALKGHWKAVIAITVLIYALAALFGTQPLKHSWKYLQMNPNRSYSTFVGLSAASLALPWCISDARRAYAGITAPVEWPGVDEEGVMRHRATDALKGLIPAIFPGKESLAFDARLRSMAELRRLHWRCVEKWGGYRLWCIGRWDYVLVAKFPMGDDVPVAGPVKAEAGDVVSADELFAEFSARFDDFSAAGIYSPAQVFACYVGDDMEVGPALMASTRFPRWDAFWSDVLPGRLAFKPVPGGGRAPVRASRITPEAQPSMDWIKRGRSDASVYLDFLDSVAAAQDARRSVLVGFDVADAGGASATNAISLWAAAAKVNPRDPILMNLADTFDQQGRRFLAIGNVQGAMNCYENRILVQPHDVAAVHNFGVCLKRGGHFDDAAKIFVKAARMTPDNEPHLLEFADCAAAAQHHEDAIKVLETLKKKRPGDRELDRRISKIKSALYRKNIKEYYK